MTISEQTPRVEYTGDGVQTVFAFVFTIIENNDLFVNLQGILQVENTDYTIENLTDAGGDVDFGISAPPPDGDTILIRRETDLTQDVVYTPFDPFPAKSHEGALDKLTMILQESAGFNSDSDFITTGDWVNLGDWTFAAGLNAQGPIILDNEVSIRGRNFANNDTLQIGRVNLDDEVLLGNFDTVTVFRGSSFSFSDSPVEALGVWTFASGITVNGVINLNDSAWPTDQGALGQVLSTNGAGVLSWANQSGGGGGGGLLPTDNAVITGNWTFIEIIAGTTSGNLVSSNLNGYTQAGIAEVITGNWQFNTNLKLNNNISITARNFADSSDVGILRRDDDDDIYVGSSSDALILQSSSVGGAIGISYNIAGSRRAYMNASTMHFEDLVPVFHMGAELRPDQALLGLENDLVNTVNLINYNPTFNRITLGGGASMKIDFTGFIDVGSVAQFTDGPADGSILIIDRAGQGHKVGFRNSGRRKITGNYTVTQDDEQQLVQFGGAVASQSISLPVLEADTELTIINKGSVPVTIAEDSTTINWLDGGGIAQAGNRILAANSVITVQYDTTSVLDVWGNGLS